MPFGFDKSASWTGQKEQGGLRERERERQRVRVKSTARSKKKLIQFSRQLTVARQVEFCPSSLIYLPGPSTGESREGEGEENGGGRGGTAAKAECDCECW